MNLDCILCKNLNEISHALNSAADFGLRVDLIRLSSFTVLKILKEAHHGMYLNYLAKYKHEGTEAFDGMELSGVKIECKGNTMKRLKHRNA